jgi:ankyrin repeat protein
MPHLIRLLMLCTALLAPLIAAPAAAQFSDSYNLIKAFKDKDANAAIELLDKPGNTLVNSRDTDTGDGGIHIATRRSDLPWVGLILKYDGNVNLQDQQGNTALLLATIGRWQEGVDVFLRVKAQPDIQNRLGETPLLKAVQARDTQIVEALLKAGANPDLTDNSGTSPRIAAARDPRASRIAELFETVAVKKNRIMQGPSL